MSKDYKAVAQEVDTRAAQRHGANREEVADTTSRSSSAVGRPPSTVPRRWRRSISSQHKTSRIQLYVINWPCLDVPISCQRREHQCTVIGRQSRNLSV